MHENEELKKPYNPTEHEDLIYKKWEESGFFNPDNLPGERGESFTIIMPPTNANGNLHAGHGLVMTIEDIMIRFNRMAGKKTLWLPGNDHAGFETQVVYEKELEKMGRSRFDIPPKKLYKEIWDFTQNNRSNINSQVKKMGSSCDWSREKFTLDEDIVKTVYQTFKKLFDDDLIYRGKRIISWCPKHQTSFSDLEIIDEERIDKFYYLKYGPFIIGTTRPETKFGDKYVVMHPNDKRYASYKDGQKIDLEWINGPITATVVKDESIDMEFGTGVMTITPWHDAVDFEIAERHNLDKEQIIDERGRLLPIAGEFAGMKITEAREKMIEKLKLKNLVEKIDDNYKHNVKLCYKCNSLIEPQIKSQWFLKMRPLAEPIIKAIEKKEIKYIPEHYEKISLHWLNNIIDWNISRQITWGIPIPAKICEKCGGGFPDLENKIETCPKCGKKTRTDGDTFDTWFSSGQWPFASLGYPNSNDFKTFYPTQVMETAGEIIFFWVARMLMLGLYITGKLPFNAVYLHGLVLDAKGRKMSKSKNNVINPLDLTSKYGTDALRIAMVIGNTPGTSLALSEDKLKAYKHFANKIWNIARFVLENAPELPKGVFWDRGSLKTPFGSDSFGEENKKYIEEFNALVIDVTGDMENYRFYLAAEKLYHYTWHTFADIIIEESKTNENTKKILMFLFREQLKLLHPFMPFITEKIWSMLPDTKNLLMVEKWPTN
ncbi:MAG: valine--tRNA ligase [Patescibacteria group bacterium]